MPQFVIERLGKTQAENWQSSDFVTELLGSTQAQESESAIALVKMSRD